MNPLSESGNSASGRGVLVGSEWLSGYLDGELTQQQRQQVERLLDESPALRSELAELEKMQSTVKTLPHKEIGKERLNEMASSPTQQVTRKFGWVLYVVGLAVLVGWGVFRFLRDGVRPYDDEVHMVEKIETSGLYIGFVLLLLSVLRQRMNEARNDRYKDVQI